MVLVLFTYKEQGDPCFRHNGILLVPPVDTDRCHEARNEITLRQKNDSATILTTSSTLRREIDTLDGKMKSDIANLKHE